MDRSEKKKQRDRRQTARLLPMISQFAISMVVPIFLCFYVGYLIDKHFGTSFMAVVLFFVGALAGFTNVYKLARGLTAEDRNTDDGSAEEMGGAQSSDGTLDRNNPSGGDGTDNTSDIL
ncbi:MAG: AtpZ/AtpI family protein [Lachnospiraceae bacterium]|nr:AtpZ/AtpI family protein [Lachnospiraceae bacterium]